MCQARCQRWPICCDIHLHIWRVVCGISVAQVTARSVLALYLVLTQTGCAVYLGASTVSLITTGKGIPEHSASQITGADCGAVNWLTGKKYYCETRRDAGTHYVNTL